jgi:hypothetical protein
MGEVHTLVLDVEQQPPLTHGLQLIGAEQLILAAEDFGTPTG